MVSQELKLAWTFGVLKRYFVAGPRREAALSATSNREECWLLAETRVAGHARREASHRYECGGRGGAAWGA